MKSSTGTVGVIGNIGRFSKPSGLILTGCGLWVLQGQLEKQGMGNGRYHAGCFCNFLVAWIQGAFTNVLNPTTPITTLSGFSHMYNYV